ncbi:MAG: IseA DL-endopeptidase inhibitor family protein [Alicyclobacillus sp.]|nr:IseA DL-endopeptidase inhibitor family protein [Alicyclobacillus sp.]
MNKTWFVAAAMIGLTGLMAGCGTANNTAGAGNATNTASSSQGVTDAMKTQFVQVTAAAQQAIDDFVTGKSMLGDMSTKDIGGTTYSVVASSKSDLQSLEQTYLDFMTQAQVDNLFGHVTEKDGVYVYQSMKSSGDTNDWTNAKVVSVTPKDNGYEVTLSVPQIGGGAPQTQQALLVKDATGHWVYAGA